MFGYIVIEDSSEVVVWNLNKGSARFVVDKDAEARFFLANFKSSRALTSLWDERLFKTGWSV